MKKILLFLALGALLGSCSDKLTASKAEKLIQKSLEEEPLEGTVDIETGTEVMVGYDWSVKEKAYNQLAEQGMIEMTLLRKERWSSYTYYSIQLTEKGKAYLIETRGADDKSQRNIMKSYSATLDKVEDILLIPEWNAAQVIASFKLKKTPFFVLESGETRHSLEKDIVNRKIEFVKLEKKGWKAGHIRIE